MTTPTLDHPALKVEPYNSKPYSEVREMIWTINKVVSDEVQAEFDGIAQEQERRQWRMGDLTNEIYSAVIAANICNAEGKPYTFEDVCYYVSVRFLRRNRSENTVKAWALTARRYSPKQRARYRWLDIPFSHFTYAGRQKWDVDNPNTGRKYWQDILEKSWELSQGQGYSASERQLRESFEPDIATAKTNGRTYHTGVQFESGISFAPLVIQDEKAEINPDVDIDYEAEIRDTLHRLHALVQGMAASNPRIGRILFQALSAMWQAIGGR